MQIGVRHKQLNNFFGYYDKTKNLIVIDKKIMNTWQGITVLLHEYGHFLDDVNNKYKDYFNYVVLPYNKKNWKIIVEAEKSASKWGYKLGKIFGLNLYYEELNAREIKKFFKFYRKTYFRD